MPERRTLTVIEAAAWLGIGKTTAYELIRTGQFPVRVLHVGGRRLIVRAELERYLAGGDALRAPTNAPGGAELART